MDEKPEKKLLSTLVIVLHIWFQEWKTLALLTLKCFFSYTSSCPKSKNHRYTIISMANTSFAVYFVLFWFFLDTFIAIFIIDVMIYIYLLCGDNLSFLITFFQARKCGLLSAQFWIIIEIAEKAKEDRSVCSIIADFKNSSGPDLVIVKVGSGFLSETPGSEITLKFATYIRYLKIITIEIAEKVQEDRTVCSIIAHSDIRNSSDPDLVVVKVGSGFLSETPGFDWLVKSRTTNEKELMLILSKLKKSVDDP